MRKRADTVLSVSILLACLAAPAAVSQSAAAAPAPVSRQACPAGPAVTVSTVGLSGFAGIFAGYAHSHAQGSTTDWIGGDTDYSVTLPGGRHLWDFTDAQLGTIAQTTDAILTSGTAHNVAVIEQPGPGPITATLHSSKVYAGGGHWYLGWIPEPARAATTALHTPPVPAGAGTCQGGCTYGPHIQADYPDSGAGWLLSYDVNSGTLAARVANASLYWPRYLRIHVLPGPAGS